MELFIDFLDSLPVYNENVNCYVWGTGNTAQLYQNSFYAENIKIKGYIDNNCDKWGGVINNIKIYSPKILSNFTDNDLVLICSPTPSVYDEISVQLTELEINFCHVDSYIFGLHKKELLEVYNSLYDNESRNVYFEILKCRVKANYPDDSLVCLREKNFALNPFLVPNASEVFVDVGAYTGESAERYLWTHEGICKRIISFEPDFNNFNAVQYRFQRLSKEWKLSTEQLYVLNVAVGEKNESRFFCSSNMGLGSSIVKSKESTSNLKEIKTVSLDSFFETEKNLFIKADIESYEPFLLNGAKRIIGEYKPKLAICIYHNATDYWNIPLLVKKLNRQYKMSIRHHSATFAETVLYAW
ncbi:FkbM family methyltransferase [Succinivibrio dextrinosolvens]|uniref:FkbM family methyltransferase n=1 Tax=Succinivibrio dextrinosolvens TaxID=83771 RepID=UPI001923DCE3|nr:FkbM family methyltransferase [Succinivibrio dextrinosolvens]